MFPINICWKNVIRTDWSILHFKFVQIGAPQNSENSDKWEPSIWRDSSTPSVVIMDWDTLVPHWYNHYIHPWLELCSKSDFSAGIDLMSCCMWRNSNDLRWCKFCDRTRHLVEGKWAPSHGEDTQQVQSRAALSKINGKQGICFSITGSNSKEELKQL